MSENAPGPIPPDESDAAAPADSRPASQTARPREAWEVQQRAPRRPEFAGRLTRTSDLPTEAPKERTKSKLGEHRAAAIHWEDDVSGEGEDVSPEATVDDGDGGLSRGQVWTLVGLGALVAGLGATWFAKSLLVGKAPPRPPAVVAPAADPNPAVQVLSDIEYKEVTDAMTRFLEAPTPEALRPVLRDPDRVWPLVQAYHENTPWRAYTIRTLPSRAEVRMNGDLRAGTVEVDDYQRFIVAVQRVGNEIKVDWETFTGQGEMSWDDLLLKRPTTPVLMRVLVKSDDYFNRDFPDATKHACYQLESHRDTHRVFGYVERGSKVHALLSSRARTTQRVPVVVRLRFPEGAKSDDQLEIVELVADGWLLSETTRIKEPETPAPEAAAPAPAAPTPSPAPAPAPPPASAPGAK